MNRWGGFLGEAPVMGMNFRNRHAVEALNPKPLIATAKDKILTKQLLEEIGVPVPRSLGEIHTPQQFRRLYPKLQQEVNGFVVKPASSSRGRGVLLCQWALPDKVLLTNREAMDLEQFEFYICQILHGEYSWGLPEDAALVEQRIFLEKSWIYDDLPGAPDLRIIVVKGKPVMAMTRVPTHLSKGRANLHCGGLGVGIDLTSGETTHGVLNNQPVAKHPDTGQAIAGRKVPGLDTCLRMAARCYQAVPLGYMGVDIMMDKQNGPVVIEINARPGLAVQVANRQGLSKYVPELI